MFSVLSNASENCLGPQHTLGADVPEAPDPPGILFTQETTEGASLHGRRPTALLGSCHPAASSHTEHQPDILVSFWA